MKQSPKVKVAWQIAESEKFKVDGKIFTRIELKKLQSLMTDYRFIIFMENGEVFNDGTLVIAFDN